MGLFFLRVLFVGIVALAFGLGSTSAFEAKIEKLRFSSVTNEEGIPVESATALYQDETGYVYIGSQSGLHVYNGYQYVTYKHDPLDPSSLSGNWVTVIFYDTRGRLWVGTKSGLNLFDRNNGTFERFRHDSRLESSLSSDYIKSISEDASGRLWVGTRMSLCRFVEASDSFERFYHDRDESKRVDNLVLGCYVDRYGFAWVCTEGNGLFSYDPLTKEFEHYQFDRLDETSISSNNVTSMVEDDFGQLWIGTREALREGSVVGIGGLSRFDRSRKSFVRYLAENPVQGSFADNNITTMVKDENGMLWYGTVSGDIYRLEPKEEEFVHYPEGNRSQTYVSTIMRDRSGLLWVGKQYGSVSKANLMSENYHSWEWGDDHGLSDSHVVAVFEDSEDVLWVGTMSGGLNRFDAESGRFEVFKKSADDPLSIPGNRISAIYEDKLGSFWVATYGSGLCLFDREKGQVVANYRFDPEDENSIADDRIRKIFEDSKGNLWVANLDGLDLMDRESGTFRHFRYDASREASLPHNIVMTLLEDRFGKLWIGTNGGVAVMDLETLEIERTYRKSETGVDGLRGAHVRSLLEDSLGNIWIGTRDGLDHLDRRSGAFSHFSVEDGLASNVVFGIVEDEAGYIWLSTAKGISRLDVASGLFRNFDADAGLVNGAFELNSYWRNNYGRLYFGGQDGLDSFFPKDIKVDEKQLEVALTSLKVFDRTVLDWNEIGPTEEVEISYSENYISFDFSILDFVNPLKNQYMHLLEGFDQDWVYDGTRHYANYTNLPPGEYRFRLKAANGSGLWNESSASVVVRVLPVYWQTVWFRCLVAVVVLLLAVGIHRLATINIRKKNIELRIAKDEAERASRSLEEAASEAALLAKKANVASEAKSLFLSNMSHEITTPLEDVIGKLDLVSDFSLSEKQRACVDLARRSAQSLQGILSDILDISTMEAGQLKLESVEFVLEDVIQGIHDSVKAQANAKEIGFDYYIGNDVPQNLSGDPYRLRQLLMNLVANALKFTESGSVGVSVHFVRLEDKVSRLRFDVIDTGIGIPQDKLEDIFAKFTHADSSISRKYPGSGLGLTITKQLVGLMNGVVGVESKVNAGSRFWFEVEFLIPDSV